MFANEVPEEGEVIWQSCCHCGFVACPIKCHVVDGTLRWIDNEVTINFGKKKGEKVRDLVIDDPNYLKWILRGDFARDTKQVIEDAIAGKWPVSLYCPKVFYLETSGLM